MTGAPAATRDWAYAKRRLFLYLAGWTALAIAIVLVRRLSPPQGTGILGRTGGVGNG